MTNLMPLRQESDTSLSGSNGRLAVVQALYEEAIGALYAAIDAIERGDIEARFNAVAMASEFVSHLHMLLDMSKGGEVAENLGRIYSFILGNLAFVNVNNDPRVAADAIALLEPLRDSWDELDARIAAAGRELAPQGERRYAVA